MATLDGTDLQVRLPKILFWENPLYRLDLENRGTRLIQEIMELPARTGPIMSLDLRVAPSSPERYHGLTLEAIGIDAKAEGQPIFIDYQFDGQPHQLTVVNNAGMGQFSVDSKMVYERGMSTDLEGNRQVFPPGILAAVERAHLQPRLEGRLGIEDPILLRTLNQSPLAEFVEGTKFSKEYQTRDGLTVIRYGLTQQDAVSSLGFKQTAYPYAAGPGFILCDSETGHTWGYCEGKTRTIDGHYQQGWSYEGIPMLQERVFKNALQLDVRTPEILIDDIVEEMRDVSAPFAVRKAAIRPDDAGVHATIYLTAQAAESPEMHRGEVLGYIRQLKQVALRL